MELDAVPMLGNPPPFPWTEFEKALGNDLEIQDLLLNPSNLQWREANELFSGLGKPLMPANLAIASLEGTIYFAVTKQDISSLMGELLLKGDERKEILSEEFLNGFYKFLILEAIHAFQGLDFDRELSPQLIDKAELPKVPMLTMDIAIMLPHHPITARLFISPELRRSLSDHFKKKAGASLSSPIGESIEVTLHIEGGSTTLSQKEWASIKPGDFLLLEHCNLNPLQSEGDVSITYKGHPFFGGKIKDGKIEILEHPLYREVTQHE